MLGLQHTMQAAFPPLNPRGHYQEELILGLLPLPGVPPVHPLTPLLLLLCIQIKPLQRDLVLQLVLVPVSRASRQLQGLGVGLRIKIGICHLS